MELSWQPRSVKSSQFHILVVLALLTSSPSAPALGRTAPSAEQDAERSHALKLANEAISEAEKLVPEPSYVHVYYPESRAEEEQKAEKMINAVVGLRKADAALSGFLKTHPDDLAFLWTQVHLDFLKRQLPIYEAGKEAQKPDFLPSAERDPMKTLNHILELDPKEADAYFREATLFASPDLRGLNLAPDLEKAIVCGRTALALSPENADYRITLADLFLRMGRDREAMDTLQPLAGGRHPAYLLLAGWSKLPLPPGAVFDKDGTEISAQGAAIAGKDHPKLRVRLYDVAQSAADLESFYGTYWKDFRFSSVGKDEIQIGERGQSFVAYFEWNKNEWRLVDSSRAKQAKETGLTLSVTEYRRVASAGGFAASVHCKIGIFNDRPTSTAP